jgi:hypothetical protein
LPHHYLARSLIKLVIIVEVVPNRAVQASSHICCDAQTRPSARRGIVVASYQSQIISKKIPFGTHTK